MTLSPNAQETLCQIIATYGRDLSADPRRLEAMLRDQCGSRREINLLMSAQKEGVAGELLTASAQALPRELLLSRLAQRLQDNLGVTEEAARWAVESWARAFGVLPAAPSPTPADPATPAPSPSVPAKKPRVVMAGVAGLGAFGLLCWLVSLSARHHEPVLAGSAPPVPVSAPAAVPQDTAPPDTAPAPPSSETGPGESAGSSVSEPAVVSSQAWAGERFPETRLRSLSRDDLQTWTDDDVRYALNEIYARHGFPFGGDELRLFGSFLWYQPVAGRTQAETEALVTPIEWANMKLLAQRRDELQAP